MVRALFLFADCTATNPCIVPAKQRQNVPAEGAGYHCETDVTDPVATMDLFKDFTFKTAHRLPNVPPNHKCERPHGPSWHVRIVIRGEQNPGTGWVIDFADIGEALLPPLPQQYHYHLNEIPGLENPASNHLARWIWQRLAPSLPLLHRVEIRETGSSGCVYHGGK